MKRLIRTIPRYFCLISILLLHHPALHAVWEYTLYADIGAAKITGVAQTPKGGDIGTTSMNRPTFSEINIEHDQFYEIGVGAEQDAFFAILSYQAFSPHGNSDLNNALITHSQFIPANSPFDMHVKYHWSTLNIGVNLPIQNTAFTISPVMEGTYLRYHYGFSSPYAQSKREFNLAGVSAGLIAEYQLAKTISIDFTIKNTIPISNLEIFQLELAAYYRAILKNHFSLMPNISLGFLSIDYEDDQMVPNHIRYQAQPYCKLGLTLLFSD